ncbi:MAG: DUF1573 domain-containing protein [Planctomycetaceae bacterium]|nr:DUF1573 domain-containing protein [Planctomycetaceae bacterium]
MNNEQSRWGFWQLGVALLAGLAIGTVLGWYCYQSATNSRPDIFSVTQALDASKDGTIGAVKEQVDKGEKVLLPVVEIVGSATHNFGVTQPGSMNRHTFKIRNRGQAPLELKLTRTTCKCLTMGLDKETPTIVQPGEEFPIELEFRSDKVAESFVQQAEIKTNDPHPARNRLTLKVEGRVVSRTSIRPDTGIEVSDLLSASSSRFGFNLYTFAIDDIDPKSIGIESITCDNPVLNERVQYTWKPLSEAELDSEYQAKGGFHITGTIPAGMPMASYAATITVKTTDGSEATVGITMRVKAPVQINARNAKDSGFRFVEELQYIDFGLVKPGRKTEMELLMNYRTDKKGQLDFKVAENSHPEILEVEIKDIRRTESTLVILRISVREDAPSVSLNGPKRNNMGRIKLVTDSPDAPEINLAVSVSKN